ncbi:MAG: SAM-dependent methyltransferase [Candidatus Rhabdochlamydia sp.]
MSIETAFPTREQNTQAWETLAASIVSTKDLITKTSSASSEKPGELIIIGSGIKTGSFTEEDYSLMKQADFVFYCVADAATEIDIKITRPDAYDLYVLYGQKKRRYTTYIQMSESMLYHVRQGKKVLGIFYGHPGIFVMPSHRAIKIARNEGHQAHMKSAVCALDCLCSDLGIDPSHPGLQTYEATHMLTRGQKLDTTMHVVLWQVGLIGETGFRFQGFSNPNFSVLIEYLQKHYGLDYPVTHYFASRYSFASSTMKTYRLSEMHDRDIQKKITGASTFYLSPKDTLDLDQEMLLKLHLIKPGQKALNMVKNLTIDSYGYKEMRAFEAFQQFSIPADYHHQENTGAGRFVLSLNKDFSLQEAFIQNPEKCTESIPGLTHQEVKYLSSQDTSKIQMAAKGIIHDNLANQKFIKDLFSQENLLIYLFKMAMAASHPSIGGTLKQWVIRNRDQTETRCCYRELKNLRLQWMRPLFVQWVKARGYDIDINSLHRSFQRIISRFLRPWTGIYITDDHKEVITIQGNAKYPKKATICLNGKKIKLFSFQKQCLQWPIQPGLRSRGFLECDRDQNGRGRLTGYFYPGETEESRKFISATEFTLEDLPLYYLLGIYKKTSLKGEEVLEISITSSKTSARNITVSVNGLQIEGPIHYDRHLYILSIGDKKFPLAFSGNTYRSAWISQKELPEYYSNHYTVRAQNKKSYDITVDKENIRINSTSFPIFKKDHRRITWNKGKEEYSRGHLTFFLDPITMLPSCLGSMYNSIGKKTTFYGAVPSDVKDPFLKKHGSILGLPSNIGDILLQQSLESTQKGGDFLYNNVRKVSIASHIMRVVFSQMM